MAAILSMRWRNKLVKELGVAQDSLKSSNVHIVADVDHSDAIWDAVANGICSEYDYVTAIAGARKGARLRRAAENEQAKALQWTAP